MGAAPERIYVDHGLTGTTREWPCEDNAITQSMSRPGQCWDNAVAESWFAALKNELIYRNVWATRAKARRAVFEYIEVFYNRQRRHSSLNYLSPASYEATRRTVAKVAA